MKKSLVVLTGCLLALWLAMPAWAQRGLRLGSGAVLPTRSMSRMGASEHAKGMSMKAHTSNSARANAEMRSNKGAKVKGLARAEDVQMMNTKADTNRGFTTAPGLATAATKSNVSASENENASVQAGSHKASANASASEQTNTRAQTNAGLTTAPGLATAATHTSASAHSEAAAGASLHAKDTKKRAPDRDSDSAKDQTSPKKN